MQYKNAVFEFNKHEPYTGFYAQRLLAIKEQYTLDSFHVSIGQWYEMLGHRDVRSYVTIETDVSRLNLRWLGRVVDVPVREVLDSVLWPLDSCMVSYHVPPMRGSTALSYRCTRG